MDIEGMILKQWEKAGGEYALAAKLVRKDMKKEKEGSNPSFSS